MIIEFTVGNYLSFKEPQTLSLVAANIKSKNKSLDVENTFETKHAKLLKSKAIYGSNGSGKSNLIRAYLTFRNVVFYSVKDEKHFANYNDQFFLNNNTTNEPTLFQIVFIHDSIVYRYGFTFKKNEIVTEWLFATPNVREVYYFLREGMSVKVNENQFKEAQKFVRLADKGDNEIFRQNSLFLTSVSAMGVELAKELMNTLTEGQIYLSHLDHHFYDFANMWIESSVDETLNLLKAADTGIEKLRFEIDSNESAVSKLTGKRKMIYYTSRNVYNDDGEVVGTAEERLERWESEGTKKLFLMSPFIIEALKNGRALFMDEFEARLHPQLTKGLLKIFNSKEYNPKNSQLIFTTHDTNLLDADLLRRDQIAIVEKDSKGCSTIRTLVEIQGIRNDASYEKDYLNGKYGGVPFLHNLQEAVSFE